MTETTVSERKQMIDTRAPRKHIPKKMFIWNLTNWKWFQNHKTGFCKNNEGNLIGNKDGIKNRWEEYFQVLLSQSFVQETKNTSILWLRSRTTCTWRGQDSCQSLNNHKALGTDNIPAEVYKTGSSALEIKYKISQKQYGWKK